MIYFPVIIFSLLVLVMLTRPLTVFFHELGHAIPAIILTEKKVSVYIGSFGNQEKSFKFSIGLLEIWLRYNPLVWHYGLCVPSAKEISVNRQMIYTFTGPLASFLIASIACYFTFIFDMHGALKVFLIILLGSSIFDLFVNLVPAREPYLVDGMLFYNDGHLLKQLFYYKKFGKAYARGVESYSHGDYREAAAVFGDILTGGLKDEEVFRLAITAYMKVKDYKKARSLVEEFLPYGKMTSNDFSNAGLIHLHDGLPETALAFFEKSLELNPENIYALNNKGYALNVTGKYEESIPLFDKAIRLDEYFAYAYNNRGFSKLKTGNTPEALTDIRNSISLDKENPYAYRNLGIYHLGQGEFEEALALFVQARKLDPGTDLVNELIKEAESKLL